MFERPPREKRWVSWLYVVIWLVIIFCTIPFARSLQSVVQEHWGRQTFTYIVIVAIVIACAAAALYVLRHRPTERGGYFWLLSVAAVFLGYTIELGKTSPEEALHFIQYGVLGVLVYRALAHRRNDTSIYIAAALICGILGTIDEVVQWLTPRRYWALRDIWINFFAATLVLISIAKGLKPKFIKDRPSKGNLRFVCRLAIVAIGLLAVCLLNTPARITWYAERIPWLAFLKGNESVMLEYGYRYEDSDIGIFRSRLSYSQLEQSDRERGEEAAAILDRYRDPLTYPRFLETYTPVSDPFVHEARVHLYRRDYYFSKATENKDDPEKFARLLTIAYRENQILEKYFSNTLHRSTYRWPKDNVALAGGHLLKREVYDSRVSWNLVTRVSEGQVACFFAILIIGLVVLHGYIGRNENARFLS